MENMYKVNFVACTGGEKFFQPRFQKHWLRSGWTQKPIATNIPFKSKIK